MGLTIHYQLRLPAAMAEDGVDDVVAKLHGYARTLPVAHVSPIISVSDSFLASDREDGWSTCLEFWATLIAEPLDEERPPFTGDVTTARGFLVSPGDGSEPAVFGFLRRADTLGIPDSWYWESFCKTQYGSTISNEHFVTCHRSVVALLDRAVQLGVDVTVHDEGGYWESRDIAQLVRGAGRMNCLMAAFAGRLVDVIGLEHIEAPIFDHRRFERLEMGEWEEED